MRIAYVTHFYPSAAQPERGLGPYCHAKALSRFAEIQVFCVTPIYPPVKWLRPRTYPFQQSSEPSPATSLPVKFVSYPAFPWVSRPWNGTSCAARLTPAIREMLPDVILGTFLYPDGYAAVRAARELGIPVVVEALGSDLRRANGSWMRRRVEWTLRNASLTVTVGRELREQALKFGAEPDRVRVIRRGCDAEIFQPADRGAARAQLGVDRDADLMVFAGRLVEVKGLWDLFHALPQVFQKRPEARLVCIGEGPLEQPLSAYAQRAGFSDRVKFLGSVPPKSVALWLAASNFLSLPSHSEGVPNIVIEALSCGRPVVGTNAGGIPEVVDMGSGILVPPHAPARLAEALIAGFERTWDSTSIARACRRSWQETAQETYDSLLETLNQRAVAVGS